MVRSQFPHLNFIEQVTEWVGTPASIVVHTVVFIGIFFLQVFGLNLDQILLILTTAVSLEAIYLAIFIQMTVNKNTESLEAVEDDIEDIQEDVDEIQQDVDELETDTDTIQKNVEGLEDDVEEITEDMSQKDTDMASNKALDTIQDQLQDLSQHILQLRKDLEELKKTS